VSLARSWLVESFAKLRETHDTYALPPPEQTVVFSLGYRSAVADLVYAHTLVAYGLHFGEKRRFEYAGEYLDTAITLDPKFAQPYLYADTLLILEPEPPRLEDYQKARELLLRGTRELPYNQRLWFTAGQYLSYLAPPNLDDPALAEQYRREGARLLSRACELMTDNEAIPYHCIAAASILNKAGKREALIQMLTRTLAVNDDEEIRKRALGALSRWVGEREEEQYAARLSSFNDDWQEELPQVSKEKALLLGPSYPTFACAGRVGSSDADCAITWAAWARQYDAARGRASATP
jgi:tetratricopeptide (TPR) repeat protein